MGEVVVWLECDPWFCFPLQNLTIALMLSDITVTDRNDCLNQYRPTEYKMRPLEAADPIGQLFHFCSYDYLPCPMTTWNDN
jgi:hypothetical protein